MHNDKFRIFISKTKNYKEFIELEQINNVLITPLSPYNKVYMGGKEYIKLSTLRKYHSKEYEEIIKNHEHILLK